MTSDPLDILLAHFRWANRVLLDACRPLTREQFHQPFDIGPGSLHDTMAHVIRCVEGWTARAKGGPWTTQTGDDLSIDELIEKSNAAADAVAEFVDHLREADGLARVHENTFHPKDAPPVTVRFTNGAAITHCLVHGQYHRAQAVNMLRRLGVDPLPDVDVMEWHHVVEGINE
jgi:uncharacterized damage-inducible protein DinB